MSRITKRAVDALRPDAVINDSEIPGFYCRRRGDGPARYGLKYFIDGRRRRMTIGKHGAPWTPDQARKRALELRYLIDKGEDPAQDKAKAREGTPIREFAKQYERDHVLIYKKASTARTDAYNLKNHVVPRLGDIHIQKLTTADVARVHRALKDTPYGANRVVALVSHMCTKAEEWGYRENGPNPCAEIRFYPEDGRERFLTNEEMERLGKAIRAAHAAKRASVYTVNALFVIALTGARRGEILGLKWSEVDMQRGILFLGDSKTRKKPIVISEQTVEILKAIPRREGNPHVFCGKRTGQPLTNIDRPWRRIRKDAGLEDVRIHDLRHSFASVAAAQGSSLPILGSILGHHRVETTARYSHLADHPVRAVVGSTQDTIARHLIASTPG